MPPTEIQVQVHWANDGMNLLVPAADLERGRTFHDDDGFTNDLGAALIAWRGEDRLGLHFQDRMITERGGLRRSDEISAVVRMEELLGRKGRHDWRFQGGLGVLLTGPLGGDVLQDRFHRLIRWGRTLNGELLGQLQNQYEGGIAWGPRFELGLAHGWSIGDELRLTSEIGIAFSPGVGASSSQAGIGFERLRSFLGGKLRISVKAPLRYLRSEEERLGFRGGYPRGKLFLQPSSGVSYQHRSIGVAFDLNLNVEGSGAHQGVLSFSYYLGEAYF